MKKVRVWLALQVVKIFLFWYVIAVWLSPALAIATIIEMVEGMKSEVVRDMIRKDTEPPANDHEPLEENQTPV